jgi:tetratricopeptide (TPR) repeat protein
MTYFCATRFKFLAAVLLIGLAGCGYSDEEHQKNVLNGLLVNQRYQDLESSLAKAERQYRKHAISPAQWTERFNSLADINADDVIVRFDSWVAETDSGYAHLARGKFLLVQAWEARGGELASKTSESQFAQFNRLARLAQADLLAARDKLGACALCYGELIKVNRALNQRSPEDLQLLELALGADPSMAEPVILYFQNTFPQWGGSFELMQGFIAQMRGKVQDNGIIAQLESRYCWERGRAATGRGDDAQALEWYEKGVTARPYSMLMKNLAQFYQERGEHQKAASTLEENLRLNGEWDLYTTEALAQEYFALGDNKRGNKMMARRDELQRRYNAFE